MTNLRVFLNNQFILLTLTIYNIYIYVKVKHVQTSDLPDPT